MTQLTIEVPDELARRLKTIAKARGKSVSQVAVEYLRPAAERAGSPRAILRAMARLPKVDPSAVDEMNAAIAAGRLAMSDRDLFRQ